MGRYASRTGVSMARSREEIERVLVRYGATGFIYGWNAGEAVLGFVLEGKRIQFKLGMPLLKDFMETPTGRERSAAVAEKEWEQAQRQRWRALKLVIQAKLEAVECGISTMEEEFLAFIMLPDGSRVQDHAIPAIESAYETGNMPPLLPAPKGKRKRS